MLEQIENIKTKVLPKLTKKFDSKAADQIIEIKAMVDKKLKNSLGSIEN